MFATQRLVALHDGVTLATQQRQELFLPGLPVVPLGPHDHVGGARVLLLGVGPWPLFPGELCLDDVLKGHAVVDALDAAGQTLAVGLALEAEDGLAALAERVKMDKVALARAEAGPQRHEDAVVADGQGSRSVLAFVEGEDGLVAHGSSGAGG